ncbi:MAG: PEP-utilizing enzyme, partial [Candidatus Micrarchaeota archaeon]
MVEWLYEWEKPCTPFYPAVFIEAGTHMPSSLDLNPTTLLTGRKHSVTMFYDAESLAASENHVKNLILAHPSRTGFIDEYAKIVEQKMARLRETARTVLTEGDPSLFESYFKEYWLASQPVAVIRHFNRVGVKECEKWLYQKIPDAETRSKVFSILTATSKESFAQKEQARFHELLLLALGKFKQLFIEKSASEITALLKSDAKLEELNSAVGEYLKEFEWFPCGYENEEPWNAEFVINELKQGVLDEDKVLARLEMARAYPKKMAEEKQRLLQELQPSEDVLRFLLALSEFSFYKDHLRENYNRFHYATRPFLEKVSEAIGLHGLECTELSPWQVIVLLEKKQKHSGTLLGNENYAFLFDSQTQKTEVIVGQKALDLYSQAMGIQAITDAIAKGMAASPGKVTGTVKLIFRPRHYAGEKNIVLIAPMTNPDLVPALRNAIAVVTDEGGITCHAAIVSRELGIPCIVG